MKKLLCVLLSLLMAFSTMSVISSATLAVDEPETEMTAPETEVTEPETEVTEPETEVTEPETEVTEPETDVTEPETDVTEPDTDVTEPETDVTEPDTDVTEPDTEVDEPFAYTMTGFVPAEENASVYSPYPYTNGYWDYCKNAETGLWEYKFIYDFADICYEGNALRFIDAEGYPVDFVYTDGQFVNDNGEALDEELLTVATNERNGKIYIGITYDDQSIQYPVTFAESGIASVTAENTGKNVSAYIDGRYTRLYTGENEGDVIFFYDTLYCEGVSFTVEYENGDKERFAFSDEDGTFVNDEGDCLSFDTFSFTESQEYEEWQPGGEYEVNCYYKGFSFAVPYAVSENPVKAVEYTQAEIPQYKENWDGDYSYCEKTECEDCEDRYFEYEINKSFPVQGDKITVTYTDDTVVEYVLNGKYFVDAEGNRLPWQSMVCHNDQNDKHWTVGENKFTFELYGYNVELTASVLENGIADVEFKPLRIIENNFGEWVTEDEDQFYVYNQLPFVTGAEFTVTFTDGNAVTYTYDKDSDWFVDAEGNYFEFSINTEHTSQYENPWGVDVYELPVDVADFATTVKVTIVKNSVAAIAFEPAEPYVFAFEQDGFWVDVENPETGEIEEKFWYDTSACDPYAEGNKLYVQYTSGKVDVFTYDAEQGKFLNANGVATSAMYDIEFVDPQEYVTWSIDAPEYNYIAVTFMGVASAVRIVLDNGEAPQAANINNVSNGNGYVTLAWDNVANAEKYIVYRRAMDKYGKFTGYWTVVGETTECIYQDAINASAPGYYVYFIHTENAYGKSVFEAENQTYVSYVPAVSGFGVAQSKKGVSIKWNGFDGQIAIYRRAAGEAEWTYLATLDGSKKAVIDPNVSSGTYYKYAAIRIDGENASGVAESSLIKYLATPHMSTIKNAASGIYFNWTKSEGATAYRVYRRGAGEKYYTLIATTSNLWYCDQAVGNQMGKYYKYTVKAVSGNYMSDYEDGLVLQRNLAPALTSVANTNNGVVVKWNKLNNATGYAVYRRGAGQTAWTYLGTTKNLQYLDTGVKNANCNYYRYTVRAFFGSVYGSFDANGLVILRLTAPKITRVRNDAYGIRVEFNAIKGAKGYYVYQKTSGSSWVRVGTTTSTSFVDVNVKEGVYYTYTVKAFNGSYMSDYVATTTAHRCVPAPGLPSLINAANGVKVTWYAVANADKYYIGRRDVGGTWTTLKTITKAELKKDANGQCYYVDITAVDGKTYNYTVQASVGGITSGYFDNRYITYYAPVDVLSAKSGTGTVTITWERSPKAASYIVLRKADGASGYSIYKSGVKGTSFTDDDVTSGKTYSYKVWATGGPSGMQGMSADGAVKSCTAK